MIEDINDIEELIDLLPESVTDKLTYFLDDIMEYRDRFSESTPEFIRVLIAHLVGKNIVKLLKDEDMDGNFARGKVVEVFQWAFELEDWTPKWATKPTEA